MSFSPATVLNRSGAGIVRQRQRGAVTSSTSSLFSTTTSKEQASIIAAQRNERKVVKKKNKQAARDKRREFIGMAKAVDRGQWQHVYSPGGSDGKSFAALSGLPLNQNNNGNNNNDPDKQPLLFTVLGIESSCDDTGAAVVRSDGVILGEALASQHDVHEEFGGVVPGLARNAHLANMDRVVEEALHDAGLSSVAEVDAVGVTVGPGLEICLRVGCHKARDLALHYRKPFVAVHHLEAHILMARMVPSSSNEGRPEFPFLALLVSGGHCQMLKCMGIGHYSIIGGTIDDSLGEAFDKTARLLGLPTGGGGGPAIEKLARDGDPKSVPLPVPMQKRKDFDFSYAGLKTSVRKHVERLKQEENETSASSTELSYQQRANVAASFQHVAIRHIEERLGRAMALCETDGIRSLAVVGGVAANGELRRRLQHLCDERVSPSSPGDDDDNTNNNEPWSMYVPPPRLCTDQGSMSAWAAIERISVGSTDEPLGHDVYARFPFSTDVVAP